RENPSPKRFPPVFAQICGAPVEPPVKILSSSACGDIGAQGVTFDTEVAKVALKGEHLAGCPEIPSQMFSVLAGCRINIDMIAAASTVIACIVAAGDLEGAVGALSQAFLH
ncbi:MAG: hypothetical protein CVV55_06960, partial [Synergistetes bacterium HGW-Synergistetes-2]